MTGEVPKGRSSGMPVDPDVPERPIVPPSGLAHFLRTRWDVLGVIALGGAVGSAGRYGLAELMPHAPGGFASSTLVANVSGALLIGVLMVFVQDMWPPGRYRRPFLGVGVLGGYTTFSTYVVDLRASIASGQPVTALAYLFGTLVTGLLAVWLGLALGQAVTAGARRDRVATSGHGALDIEEERR